VVVWGTQAEVEELSDEELRAKTDEFRSRIKDKQEDLDGALLEEAFAVRGGDGCRNGGCGRERRERAELWVGGKES
jgi:preprotein translocase subunit SecA